MTYASKLSQIQTTTPRMLLRHIALEILSSSYHIAQQFEEYLSKPRIHVLNLHHVFQDEEEGFRNLLGVLSTNHSFISYSEAVNRILTGQIDRPYMTFTFDDGYKNCVQAAKILNEFGAQGCFFVNPTTIGSTDLQSTSELPHRTGALSVEFLSWPDVDTLLRLDHEIGNHTMSHPNLAELTQDQLHHEIGEAHHILTKRTGAVPHFAWPFGSFHHFNAAAARIVFDVGHQTCASSERGCHTVAVSNHRELCIRREHVIAAWPPRHTLYFMARSSKNASTQMNFWPAAWGQYWDS